MENFNQAATKYTLAIDFDVAAGILELSGSSYPENAVDFFQPLLNQVKQYITEKAGPLTIHFRLVYMNTSSTKCVLDLLDLLEEYARGDGKVQVFWHYAEDDEDIQEMGQEFSEDIRLPFTLVPQSR